MIRSLFWSLLIGLVYGVLLLLLVVQAGFELVTGRALVGSAEPDELTLEEKAFGRYP